MKTENSPTGQTPGHPLPGFPLPFQKGSTEGAEMIYKEGTLIEWENEDFGVDVLTFWGPSELKTPDYEGYWLKFDTWARDEAILLLHNICPANILGYGVLCRIISQMRKPVELARSLQMVDGVLDNSQYSKKINSRNTPKEFVQWAHSKGFEIPEPLKPLLHTTDHSMGETPPYLDPKNKNYATELALAVKTWLAVFHGVQKPSSLTPAQRIEKYLASNPETKGKSNLIERLTTVCNPKKRNGKK